MSLSISATGAVSGPRSTQWKGYFAIERLSLNQKHWDAITALLIARHPFIAIRSNGSALVLDSSTDPQSASINGITDTLACIMRRHVETFRNHITIANYAEHTTIAYHLSLHGLVRLKLEHFANPGNREQSLDAAQAYIETWTL